MAEFCLKCWNEMNGTNHPPNKYMISKDLDLCEGCGKWTYVIIIERKYDYLNKMRFIIFPFKIVLATLFVLFRIPISPCLIYKKKKTKNKDPYQK